MHSPDFKTFQELARGAKMVPVYRRVLGDALTPVSAFHKIDAGRCACLFESVVGGEKVGRYSFLATDPFFEIEAYGRRVTTNAHSGVSASGQPTLVTRQFDCDNPLEELRRQVEAIRAVHLPELPPFCSGAVGYAGYDTVRYFERLPHAPPDDRCVPDMAFAFYDQMVVFDNVSKLITVVAAARLDKPGVAAQEAYDDACRRIDQLVQRLALPSGRIACRRTSRLAGRSARITPRISPRPSTKTAVRKCVEYIRAGDIFQVVLSQRLETSLDGASL